MKLTTQCIVIAAPILVLALAVTGCTFNLDSSSPAPDPTTTTGALLSKVIITGDVNDAPPQCSPQAITERMVRLFEAVNHAQPDIAFSYFGGAFMWYCMHEPDEEHTVYGLVELDEYFQQRYEQHEQIRLESIQFNGWESQRNLVHFGMLVQRSADDLDPAVNKASGKGAYHCEAERFVALCSGGYSGQSLTKITMSSKSP